MTPKEIVWLTGLALAGAAANERPDRRRRRDRLQPATCSGASLGNRRSFIGGQLVRPRFAALKATHTAPRYRSGVFVVRGRGRPCPVATSMIDFANWLGSLRRLGWRFIVSGLVCPD